MSNNELTLKPIKELLSESFYIPDYQRGYRWTKRQVKELLDDVLEFSEKEGLSKKEFYCLQPIVIRKKEGEQWELVDGQQRLTTIFLILSYFNSRFSEDFRKEIFSIEYQTRVGSKEYLTSLAEAEKEENIDYFHIYESYEVIRDWFKERQHIINDIESAFLNKVKVIWYEINEEIDPVEVFSRLNIGKIPLTSSELVKGLFLKSKNFRKNEVSLQQLKIAQEWDIIEKSLQSDELWLFMTNQEEYSNRIEYILKMIADENKSDRAIKQDSLYTFLVFNELLATSEKYEKLWGSVKKNFMTIEQWYKDRYLYHLVGFLVDQGESIADIKTISASSITKREFNEKLIHRIFSIVFGRNESLSDYENREELSSFIDDSLASVNYDDNRKKISSILLLFNIATLLQNKKSNMRFQFDRFKKENWDIEHVHSVSSEKPKRVDAQKLWLENILVYFTGEKIRSQQVNKLKELSDPDIKTYCDRAFVLLDGRVFEESEFTSLFEDLLEHFNADVRRNNDNSIGNLTLLDSTTNRSYQNAIFPMKRERILGLDKKGTFVPLCTKNLFLKYYSHKIDDMMFWCDDDIDGYMNAIKEVLTDFFSVNKEL